MTTTHPGIDAITLTIPPGRHLCSDRHHRNLGRLADVIVAFGQLGDPRIPRECLWRECWGRSYPMCSACWETTRQIAQKARPHVVVRDASKLGPP